MTRLTEVINWQTDQKLAFTQNLYAAAILDLLALNRELQTHLQACLKELEKYRAAEELLKKKAAENDGNQPDETADLIQ